MYWSGTFVITDGPILIHYYWIKSLLDSDLLSFYLISIFCSWIHPRYYTIFNPSVSLGSLWLWEFLRLSFFLPSPFPPSLPPFPSLFFFYLPFPPLPSFLPSSFTFMVLRSTSQVFCRICLTWGLSDIFLMIRLRLRVLGRKTEYMKGQSHHMVRRVYTVNMTSPCSLLAEEVFVSLLYYKILFPPSLHTLFFESKPLCVVLT